MFLSKHMMLHEACELVNERTKSTGRGPIWQALKEGAVSAERWQDEKWIPASAKWWNDPDNFNWPASPLGLFPNLPDASMFRVERRIIDELWPTSESGGRKRHGRPPDTSMAKADAPHLKSMSKLVEEGLTPTAAAREVVRHDGSGVPGRADPESKVRRLVGRFKN